MKFPKAILHYGLTYQKEMEQDEQGNKILGYRCVNYPALGTSRHMVSTWLPSKEYCESVVGSIHYTISQWIADYVRSVEILKKHGKDVAAREFYLVKSDVAPFNPEAQEWPETLNHHGIIYWREIEETSSKDIILKYTCKDFPFLGTLKLKVDTVTPNQRYKTAVLAQILHKINQFLTDYFMFLEDLRIKSKLPTVFDHSDSGTTNLLEPNHEA